MEGQLHRAGEVISDRYQIIMPLGQGGSATTYAANDLWQNQRVAIKVLSLRNISEWKILELFEREAKTLKNLNHPRIPKYLDYFTIDTEEDRRFYLVQELAEGESLDKAVHYGWRVSEEEVKAITRQMLDILNYLHRLNPPVIHRDIKPQNIIRNSDNRIYLVDFGAVQALYNQTFAKTFVGTLGYMPPEQFRGETCFASDLYALGATLLFLLTHRNPAELPQKRLKIDFRDHISTSERFKDWLEKMLEPAVEDRFQSAQDALQALERETAPSAPVTTYTPLTRPPSGCRVQIQRTPKKLAIYIPPVPNWILIIVGSISILQLFVFDVQPLLLRLLLLSTYALTMVAVLCLECRLDFTREIFQIRWGYFGIDLVLAKGISTDIVRVEKEVRWRDSIYGQQKITSCTIWEGVKKRCFATSLTEIEQDWVVQCIRDYLGLPPRGLG
jgi:serine/threonine protein kinase